MNNSSVKGEAKLTLDSDANKEKIIGQDAPALESVELLKDNQGEYSVGTVSESMLSDDERKTVERFVQEIDVSNQNQVRKYGSNAQKGITDFSVAVLNKVKTRNLGEIGDSLKDLTVFLNETTEPAKKGLASIFQKPKRTIERLKADYAKAEVNINRIEKDLEQHQVILSQDISLYEQMYVLNKKYCRELTVYIIAGKKALDLARRTTLEDLKKKAEGTQDQEDLENNKHFMDMCVRFEKKLLDLELTRTVSIQSAPQIRLLQDNDETLLEKIQSSLINTIPLWRNQMVLALGIEHSQRAVDAQNAVTDATNRLIETNAQKLRMASTDIAKQSERPVVDVETLRRSNQELITSLSDIVTIHEEGYKIRQETQQELEKLEQELKQALLDLVSKY